MKTFLEKTAWPMAVPEPGSAFHLLFVLFGLAAALWIESGFVQNHLPDPIPVVLFHHQSLKGQHRRLGIIQRIGLKHKRRSLPVDNFIDIVP